MMDLRSIEFYGTPEGSVMIAEKGKPLREYTDLDRTFTQQMIERIKEFYPEAFAALCELYTRSSLHRNYYEYLIVHRFIRCNFVEYDNRPDIDTNGIFCFEFVSCPLRGECKWSNIICNPKFNSTLSERELEVMKCFYHSMKIEDIADKLFIAIDTVKKHKRNVLQKLNMHSLSEFISYASQNKLYDHEL